MKTRCFAVCVLLALFISSCGPSAPTEPNAVIPTVNDVVILVVDDFVLHSEPVSNYDSNEGGNCIVQPDGQVYGSTGTNLGDEIPRDASGNPISHGDSVYNDILFQDAGITESPLDDSLGTNPSWLKRFSVLGTERGQLIVVGVDTEGYTTQAVADNISSAMTFLGSGYSIQLDDGTKRHMDGVSRFVINMSFAIIPCKGIMSLADYNMLLETEDELKDLRDELIDLGISEENEFETILMRYEYQQLGDGIKLEGDPLYDLAVDASKNPDVVFVASAGNKGRYFPYPFAPAIWDFVISVSSNGVSSEDAPTLDVTNCHRVGIAEYSNCGEIKMDGESRLLVAGVGTPPPALNTGTSYAAPKLSYRIALALLNNEFGMCASGSTALSMLGYANESGVWKNKLYNDIVTMNCPTPMPSP